MALNINGTTGISGVDASVSAPALTGTDSNTGISFPSADTIKFSTGGVERMSITNSGVTGVTGKIVQFKYSSTTTNYNTTSSTPQEIANLALSITPTNSSNLILAQTNLKAVSYHNTGNSAKQDFYISADGGSSYAERVRSWSYRYDTGGIYLEQPIVVWYIAVAGSTSAKNFKVYHASGTNLQVDINYNSAGSELTDTSHLFLWEIVP